MNLLIRKKIMNLIFGNARLVRKNYSKTNANKGEQTVIQLKTKPN